MVEPTPAELIADYLQRYDRNPMRYHAQTPREVFVLGHLDVVLRLALGRPIESCDPALCVPALAADLQRAASDYIRQRFFRDSASHYDVLGLAPEASADAVRENFRLLMQLIHPDRQGIDTPWAETFAARANCAYSVLKGRETRAEYDRQQAAAHAREVAMRIAIMPDNRGVSTRVAAHRKRPLDVTVLPEWVSADVGGFVRRYSGFMVFAGLIAVSALVIGTMVWPERESLLTAEAVYTPERASRVMAVDEWTTPARSVTPTTTPDQQSDAPILAVASPARSPIQSAVAIQVANPGGAIDSGAGTTIPGASNRVALSSPPGSTEVEALIGRFVSSYESGNLPMFADLFDDDAQTDLQRGRAAIRNEYDQLFRSTMWRRMSISQLVWQSVGDRTAGRGEVTLKTGWTDGREVGQRGAVDMELVRHGGRTVIAKLSLRPRSEAR